jgi:hypothetical protein
MIRKECRGGADQIVVVSRRAMAKSEERVT